MNLRILLLLVLALSLFGCCIAPSGQKSDGTTGIQYSNSTNTGGASGNTVSVNTTHGGMSDPSKCNNLPPQQMADCLEESMGN